MTVLELRRALKGLDDDMHVVMSKDGEGNMVSALSEVQVYRSSPDNWPECSDAVSVVCLWPVN